MRCVDYLRVAMGRQKRNKRINLAGDGFVFSTVPNWAPTPEPEEMTEAVDPKSLTLYVSLDRKQRAGKPVTMVEGLERDGMALMALGKELKTLCGAGGAVKEGAIIVQGDHRDKVIDRLESMGYKVKRKGG